MLDHVPVESFDCHKCPLNTGKQKASKFNKVDSSLLYSQSSDNFKYLIVVDIPLTDTELSHLRTRLHKHLIYSYDIYSAIRCSVTKFDSISIQDTFNKCNPGYDYTKYIGVITFGRGLFSITENTDDFSGWSDFAEYIFNQTFIYTPIYSNASLKVFPLPPVKFLPYDKKDCFEGFFIDHQLSQAVNCKIEPSFRTKPVKTIVIEQPNQWLARAINKDPNGQEIALDTETNSLNVYIKNFEIGIVIISYDDKLSYILRFKDIDKKLFEQYLDRKKLIGANIKYDISALVRCGINRDCLHIADDIILMWHMLNNHISKLSLKSQVWFLGMGGYDKELEDYKSKFSHLLLNPEPEKQFEEIEYDWDQDIEDYQSGSKKKSKKKKRSINYLLIPENVLFKYAGYDSALTFRRRNFLLQNSQTSVIEAYRNILKCADTFLDMEIDGIKFDRDGAIELMTKLKAEMIELNNQIKIYFENEYRKKNLDPNLLIDFDVASDDKLATAIENLGWTPYVTTKSGRVSTGEENLIYWKKDGISICDTILDYRGKASLCNTHLAGWLNAISEYDGMVHPNFGLALANTLRSRHSKPNAANIPAHGISSKLIRPLFFKDEIVFEYDYSGFQLRIMALYSKDDTLLNVYKTDGDLHSTTGAFVFHNGMDVEEFTRLAKSGQEPYKTNRFKSKQINFALIFSKISSVLLSPLKREWEFDNTELKEKILNENYNEESDKTTVMQYFNENKTYFDKKDYVYESFRNPDGEWIRTNKINYLATVAKIIWTKFFSTYPGVLNYIKNQHTITKEKGYVDGFFGTKRHLPMITYSGKQTNKKDLTELENQSVNSDVQTFEAYSIYQAMVGIRNDLREKGLQDIVKLRVMTHDSLTGSFPKDREDLIPIVNEIMQRNMPIMNKYEIDFTVEGEFYKVWKDNETIIQAF